MTARRRAPLPSRFEGPGDSPGYLLWKVSNAWQRRQRAALRPLGLTHSQFVLLAVVAWFGASEPLSQARVAELAGMDPMTTSDVVRTLEAAGLVERRSHPGDARANAIVATRAGRDRAKQAIGVVEATDRAFFEPLGARGAAFVRALRALTATA